MKTKTYTCLKPSQTDHKTNLMMIVIN